MLLLALLLLAAYALAIPAAEQFHLDPQISASNCFYMCHLTIASLIPLTGKNVNTGLFITLNCREEQWRQSVAACLPMSCTSAPDVAYAVEYATSFCERGGVPGVKLQLPDWYLQTPGGGYYNETLVRREPERDESGATRTAPAVSVAVAAAVLLTLM